VREVKLPGDGETVCVPGVPDIRGVPVPGVLDLASVLVRVKRDRGVGVILATNTGVRVLVGTI
jgi:hypothetical protein